MTDSKLIDYTLYIGGVDKIVWTPRPWKRPLNLYVEILLEKSVRRTRAVKRNNNPNWNEEVLLSAKPTSILSFTVKHDATLTKDPCVGGIDIELNRLLHLCENNQYATLQLEATNLKSDDTSRGFITVRLTAVDLSQTAADALTNARNDTEHSGIMGSVTATSDSKPIRAMDAGMGLDPQDNTFVKALGSVLSKLDVFVRIVDKTSQVHPYVNFAWQVISSLYKAIQGQLERDKKLVDLVMTMEEVYSFVDAIQTLPDKMQVLQDIITKILKQTVECAIFIRQFTGHGFGARLAKQTFSNASQIMDDLSNNLIALKRSFDSGGTLQAVFVSTRILEKVEKLVQIENLKHLNPVKMDAFSRPLCLPDTRQDILKFIADWLTTPSKNENTLWLHAMAGFGKSTISTTVASYFRELERLGAFIFFDRNIAASADPAAVIRTLAYKLAYFDPSIRATVSAQIECDLGITEASMHVQFAKLLVEPLASATVLSTRGPIIIIIDALDECGDPASRKDLLSLFAQELGKLPPYFRVLITSRRESDIEAALSHRPNIVAKALDNMDQAGTADVSSYLRHHMTTFRLNEMLQLASDWPGEHKMQTLINLSGGLFIWASTAVKFIASGRHPDPRLDTLLDPQSRRRAESGLDALYATALVMAGEWDSDEGTSDFCAVLGAVVVGRTLVSDSTLDRILGLDGPRSSKFILSRLRCLLQWSPGQDIRILHSSFADYLSDTRRCGGRPWFIDASHHNQTLALECLRLMQAGLKCNICELETSHIFNNDVSDLQVRIARFIPPHLSYACRFWADHLRMSVFDQEILGYLDDFLRLPFLYLLEALSLIEEAFIASRALKSTINWVKGHNDELAAFASDINQFVSAFRETRSHSARHVYLSALAFFPTAVQYRSRFPKLHLVVAKAFKLDHLLHAVEAYGSDTGEFAASIYGVNKVYPCLALYAQARIINANLPDETKREKLAVMTKPLAKFKFNRWDDIAVLKSHRTVKNHFLKSINDMSKTGYHDANAMQQDVMLGRVLKIDAVAVDALLLAKLQNQSVTKPHIQTAQYLLNLLQTRLDFPLHPSLKHLHTRALIKLSDMSGLYPESMILEGITSVSPLPQYRGGFGDIYKEFLGGEEIAVKVLRNYSQFNRVRVRKMLSLEAVIWRQLNHPNVLPFYGVVQDSTSGPLGLASPWMPNGNIVEFLKATPDTACFPLILDIAEGLNYLHMLRPSIIHGDLKGNNILITPSGRACLADFGISIPDDSASSRGSRSLDIVSTSSGVFGAIRWLAPELLDEYSCGNSLASDVYAYGCVCYEIFSGQLPFFNISSSARVILMILKGTRPSRPSHDLCRIRGLDDGIWCIIESCWAQEPDHRPAAHQIVERLHSSPNFIVDERPVDNYDLSFPSRISHADHPLSTLSSITDDATL